MRSPIPASLLVVALAATVLLAASPDPAPRLPQYTGDNQLLRPADYREWIFLSSGLGMSYSSQPGHEMFTNVFAPQWAYQEFLKSGQWPDKTMFVVEDRGSTSKGSINKAGHYQTDWMGIGVEVKDASHFPDKWAYFSFDEDNKSAAANPKQACWSCHDQHAAVEHTFVQFYPTLKPVAKKFGTYRESAETAQ
ncbi:MAG: cytochrome P460 family protein [Terriglobales bacterium]